MVVPNLSQLSGLHRALWRKWPDRETLVRVRNRHLRRLVRHAYDNVPYYRALFDRAGVNAASIRTTRDLQALPITTRADLRDAPVADIVARGIDPQDLILRLTSGSSGSPMRIRRTWFEERLLQAVRWRADQYHGVRRGDRVARIGLSRPRHPKDHQLPARGVAWLRPQRLELSCLEPPEKLIASLRDFKPDVISGFAGSMAQLARYVDSRDREIIRPRYITPGGEVLTPPMRKQVAEGFGAPVLETYGCHEFNLLAFECRDTGLLHINDDALFVEVIREDDGRRAEPGERGAVVGTALFSYAAPFIRYRLGDIVTASTGTCLCGLPLSTVRAVQGRMIDYVTLPSGRVLHPYDITWPLIQKTGWLSQYCVVQERQDLIILRIVPTRTVSEAERREVRERLAATIGPEATVECEIVSEIPRDPSGKFRVVRSMVGSPYDNIEWGQPHGKS